MKWNAVLCMCAAFAHINGGAYADSIDDVAQLSDVWAAGHYLAPDIACDPHRWDAAFRSSAVRIIQGRGTLERAQAALMSASGAYVARAVHYSLTGDAPSEKKAGNRIALVSPDLMIVRVSGALRDDEMRHLGAQGHTATRVLDLRSDPGQGMRDLVARSEVFENGEALQALGMSVGKLPPVESVIYHGYPSESWFSSGYFRSAMSASVSDQETEIAHLEAAYHAPLIVVGNRNTLLPRALLAARVRGRAFFISTDGNFAYDGLPSTEPDMTRAGPVVRLARYQGVSLTRALAADAVIGARCADDDRCLAAFVRSHRATARRPALHGAACTALPAREDEPDAMDELPGMASRLYAVAKLYHTLRLFYPAPDALGDMRTRYTRALQEMTNVHDAAAYVMAIAHMLAPIRDGHVEIVNTTYLEAFGRGDLPITPFFYEGKVYIGCEAQEAPGLQRGDRIVSVDGKTVDTLLAQIAEVKTASPGRNRLADSARYLFRGAPGSAVTIELAGQDGAFRRVVLTRTRRGSGQCKAPWTPHSGTEIEWLTPQAAYLNMGVLSPQRIDELAPELSRARFLVVDMRAYPREGAWRLAAHLSTMPRMRVARFVTPVVSGRDAGGSEYHDALTTFTRFQEIQGAAEPHIGAQILILMDDNTSSQGEHAVLLLKAAAQVRTIGTRTAGNLGDATSVILPGHMQIRFTGDVVEDLDGQRILGHGIAPDVLVSPTLEDVLLRRDPQLEAARRLIRLEMKSPAP